MWALLDFKPQMAQCRSVYAWRPTLFLLVRHNWWGSMAAPWKGKYTEYCDHSKKWTCFLEGGRHGFTSHASFPGSPGVQSCRIAELGADRQTETNQLRSRTQLLDGQSTFDSALLHRWMGAPVTALLMQLCVKSSTYGHDILIWCRNETISSVLFEFEVKSKYQKIPPRWRLGACTHACKWRCLQPFSTSWVNPHRQAQSLLQRAAIKPSRHQCLSARLRCPVLDMHVIDKYRCHLHTTL